jgi:hypothetical protein
MISFPASQVLSAPNQWIKNTSRQIVESYRRNPPFLRSLLFPKSRPDFIFQADSSPNARRDVLSPSQSILLPEATALPLRPDASHLGISTYTVPPDFIARIPNARYCSTNHVVIDDNHQIVRESCNAGKLEYFQLRNFYQSPSRSISGPTTLWKLRFFNYYHLLTEALPRLIALQSSSLISSIDEVQLLCPGGLSPVERFFLSKMGFGEMPILEVDEGPLYIIEDLLLSSLKTQLQSGYLAPRYVKTLQSRLLPKRRSTRNRRLFISRENAGRRRIQNQNEVETCLKKYGFESIVMEKLSLQEQIETMYDAEAVISPHGAGLTNLLFGRRIQVLEIFPSREIAPHYFFLAKSLGHSYRFMCGEEQTLNPASFEVNLDQLRTSTEELLDHIPSFV